MARLYSHFYRVIQDIQGNIVPGVQGTITLADTPTPATLYVDPEGTSTLPNPLFNSTQYGSFSVYLDTGHYDMAFFKEGYIFEPLQDIQISEASGGVASLVGTANRVLVSTSTGDIVLSAPQDLHPDASLQFAHLGLGTPANGSLGLLVATGATFQAPVNVSSALTVSGVTTINSTLQVNGIVGMGSAAVAGFALVTGANPVYIGGNLGVQTNPATAMLDVAGTGRIRGALAANSTLTVNGATALTSTLQVNGVAGFGGAPVAGYSLTVYGSSQLAANVTVGMVGTAATTTLDVNGTVRSRGAFQGDSTGYFVGKVGIQTPPHASYGLIVNGDAYFYNALTVAGAAAISGQITGGAGMTLAGNIDTPGSVNASYLSSTNGIYAASTLTCNTLSTQYIQTGSEVGIMRSAQAGWALSVNGAVQTNYSIANKLGAGPWGESSSRYLKRAIEDIPDALGLLLAQRGRRYEWDEEERARVLPGPQHGFVYDEVTVEQWKDSGPDGEEILTLRGSEALFVEALRQVVQRLDALEHA